MQQSPSERQIQAVQALVEVGLEALAMRDSLTNATPLHTLLTPRVGSSSRHGNHIREAIVRILVQAVPGTLSLADRNLYLPLHCACEKGADASIVALLLEADPAAANKLTKKNDTALSLACSANKSIETVKLLLRANPDATTRPNDYGFLPIHCVCRAYQPRLEIVQALIQANPLTVACPTNAGEFSVHVASNNTSASVGVLEALTKALVDYGGGKDSIQTAVVPANEVPDRPTAVVPSSALFKEAALVNKVGNTPRKKICFVCVVLESTLLHHCISHDSLLSSHYVPFFSFSSTLCLFSWSSFGSYRISGDVKSKLDLYKKQCRLHANSNYMQEW
jgi:Ankyrin repeats (3 copies)